MRTWGPDLDSLLVRVWKGAGRSTWGECLRQREGRKRLGAHTQCWMAGGRNLPLESLALGNGIQARLGEDLPTGPFLYSIGQNYFSGGSQEGPLPSSVTAQIPCWKHKVPSGCEKGS